MKPTILENHICRFNDGEQSCDCFVEALEQVKKYCKEIKISHDPDDEVSKWHFQKKGFNEALDTIISKLSEVEQ